jgi:hypothetical protein
VTTFEQLSEIHLHRHIDVADPAGKLNWNCSLVWCEHATGL